MGLFWGSDAAASEKKDAPVEPTPSQPQAQSTTPSTSTLEPKEAAAPKYKMAMSRDELAEAELQEMLAEIAAEDQPKKPKYTRKAVLPTKGPDAPAEDHSMTLEDSLYPTTMSCREAFDAAFYCQSMGGKFNDVYRYGGIQSCSDHWKSFWFCMRSKSYPDEQRGNMIRDHYKKKDLKYKLGPSSEDIWESRDKKVEWGTAFKQSVEQLVGTDQEWNKREAERRAGIASGTL